MRSLAWLSPVLACLACGQSVDHADPAPACDPAVMRCVSTAPRSGAATGGGNEAGATSNSEETGSFSGGVVAFSDDYFDRGVVFSGMAQISATGATGTRVTTTYDGTSFQLTSVLKDPENWFLAAPELASGMLPTLMPLDTRSPTAATLSMGVANSIAVDGIFLASSGTERSVERAQIVLHLVDEKLRSLSGITGTLVSEVTAYRAAGSWVATTQDVTDDSGMIFFGNVPAGSALSSTTVSLSGSVSARVDVTILAGAVSVVDAIVSP